MSDELNGQYVADFETTTDPTDCRVWAWGISPIVAPNDVTDGTKLDDFMAHVESLGECKVFFHNLKFDGSFIVPWLFDNYFSYEEQEEIPTPFGTRLAPQREGTFSAVMSNMGVLYTITVGFPNGQVVFQDSMKLMNMSVATMAKAFGLTTSKGDIDYHEYRGPDHQLTDEERDYLHRDVRIVGQALSQLIGNGMTKMTSASNAIAEYRNIIKGQGISWEEMFPVLSDEVDDEIRAAYRGGFTYADPRTRARIIDEKGIVLDVNSLYPSVMRDNPMPYGTPYRYSGRPLFEQWDRDGELYTVTATFTARLKPDHIPTIQIKRSVRFSGSEYLSEIDEPVTLTATCIDWKLWNDHYDIEVHTWNGGHLYQKAENVFTEYIDKWSAVKVESRENPGMRNIAKLMLNSLYGKFASSRNVTGKEPHVKEDGSVVWRLGEEKSRDPVYTPVGAFITAYAREVTIRAAQAVYDRFMYADTDSLHLRGSEMPDLDIDENRIGAWDHEATFDRALYMRAKAYSEQLTDGTMSNHIAGVPTRLIRDYRLEDFTNGLQIPGKLVPRSVPGGVVLMETPFILEY